MHCRTLYPSYTPSYFSLEDIIATNQKVPCKVQRNLVGLGYLNTASEDQDLHLGSTLELPLWLVKVLGPRRKIVSYELPRAYAERYRNILRADAQLVDLHALAPYYYDFGLHLLPLARRDAPALSKLLTSTLKFRLRGVMDAALNCSDDDAPNRRNRFDRLELSLFQTGRRMYQDHQLWITGQSHIVKTVPAVEEMRKRKASEIS